MGINPFTRWAGCPPFLCLSSLRYNADTILHGGVFRANPEAQVKELEGLEKNEPRFIAWEELNSGLRGISIR